MQKNKKEILSINKYLLSIVFSLLTLATFLFLYIIIKSLSLAPSFTGTASDIIIALSNIVIATCAILALKNIRKFFKEKMYENALGKIDKSLINLEECFEHLSSISLNFKLISIYMEDGNNLIDDFFKKQVSDSNDYVLKALNSIHQAKSGVQSLKRWDITFESPQGLRLEKLLCNTFELCIYSSKIPLSIANKLKRNQESIIEENFSELYEKFINDYHELDKENDSLKEYSILELFKIKNK